MLPGGDLAAEPVKQPATPDRHPAVRSQNLEETQILGIEGDRSLAVSDDDHPAEIVTEADGGGHGVAETPLGQGGAISGRGSSCDATRPAPLCLHQSFQAGPASGWTVQTNRSSSSSW